MAGKALLAGYHRYAMNGFDIPFVTTYTFSVLKKLPKDTAYFYVTYSQSSSTGIKLATIYNKSLQCIMNKQRIVVKIAL